VIGLECCVLNSGQNVFSFEVGIILKNLVEARARADEFENVAHADTHPSNAGTAPTLRIVDSDSTLAFRAHTFSYINLHFPSVTGDGKPIYRDQLSGT